MTGIEACFRFVRPGFTLDVDLALPGRGVTALFGHSGSGKTTLLRLIAGLECVPHGRLVVVGESWQDEKSWRPAHRRPIGYVFQEASLFAHLTVMGNLRYGMKRSTGAQRVSLDQAIELLGIGHLLDRRPELLSGGERQRVAIARALAVSPRLLLMDEPLAALDLKRKQEILLYLERLHDSLEIPVLYVSHSPDEVARLADHLVVMENGRVLADGPLGETLARIDLPIRLGEDVGVALDGVIAERDPHFNLARVEIPGASLWCRDQGMPVGRRLRVRALARDISLSRKRPEETSIQNILPGRLVEIADDEHPGLALVQVKVGGSIFIARLSKRAVASLHLAAGQDVWLQVKTLSLLE